MNIQGNEFVGQSIEKERSAQKYSPGDFQGMLWKGSSSPSLQLSTDHTYEETI